MGLAEIAAEAGDGIARDAGGDGGEIATGLVPERASGVIP